MTNNFIKLQKKTITVVNLLLFHYVLVANANIENNNYKDYFNYIYPEDYSTSSGSYEDLSNSLDNIYVAKQILFNILTEELNKKSFNRVSGNYLAIKIPIFILAITSSACDNLLITNSSKITLEIFFATQINVPICTANMYLFIDEFIPIIKNNVKQNIKSLSKNKLKSLFVASKIAISITLAYLACTYEIATAGDGYRWLLAQATANETILNIAYYFGRYSKLLFALNLYGVFFNQLIDELISKSCIGYLFNAYPLPTENLEQLILTKHINNMLAIIETGELTTVSNKISDYIKTNNLNSSFTITDMQNIISNEAINFSTTYNLLSNLSKLIFIGTTTLFCGIAFKQVFSSRLMLENFVDQIGENKNNSIVFPLKNGSDFCCKTTVGCINNLDFTAVAINDKQIDTLLNSDKLAIVAGILSGVSLSSSTAVIILTMIDSIIKLTKNSRYKKSLIIAYLKNNNLWPYLFTVVTVPPLFYGIKNIIDTATVAEKYSEFLTSIGKSQILTTDQSIVIATTCVAITMVNYMPFAANLPRAVLYLLKKIFIHPADGIA